MFNIVSNQILLYTYHALADDSKYIMSNLKGHFTMGILIDLKKTFNTVDHSISLKKFHGIWCVG